MKTIAKLLLATGTMAVAGLIVAAPAQAQVYGYTATPVYVAPAPVYAAPVYATPAPVYVAPAPVYVAPAPTYIPQTPVVVNPVTVYGY